MNFKNQNFSKGQTAYEKISRMVTVSTPSLENSLRNKHCFNQFIHVDGLPLASAGRDGWTRVDQ